MKAFKVGDRVQLLRGERGVGTILKLEWSSVGLRASRVAVETPNGVVVKLFHNHDLRRVAPVANICIRCGALKQDHMDYGRTSLVCPTVNAGTYKENV